MHITFHFVCCGYFNTKLYYTSLRSTVADSQLVWVWANECWLAQACAPCFLDCFLVWMLWLVLPRKILPSSASRARCSAAWTPRHGIRFTIPWTSLSFALVLVDYHGCMLVSIHVPHWHCLASSTSSAGSGSCTIIWLWYDLWSMGSKSHLITFACPFDNSEVWTFPPVTWRPGSRVIKECLRKIRAHNPKTFVVEEASQLQILTININFKSYRYWNIPTYQCHCRVMINRPYFVCLFLCVLNCFFEMFANAHLHSPLTRSGPSPGNSSGSCLTTGASTRCQSRVRVQTVARQSPVFSSDWRVSPVTSMKMTPTCQCSCVSRTLTLLVQCQQSFLFVFLFLLMSLASEAKASLGIHRCNVFQRTSSSGNKLDPMTAEVRYGLHGLMDSIS